MLFLHFWFLCYGTTYDWKCALNSLSAAIRHRDAPSLLIFHQYLKTSGSVIVWPAADTAVDNDRSSSRRRFPTFELIFVKCPCSAVGIKRHYSPFIRNKWNDCRVYKRFVEHFLLLPLPSLPFSHPSFFSFPLSPARPSPTPLLSRPFLPFVGRRSKINLCEI